MLVTLKMCFWSIISTETDMFLVCWYVFLWRHGLHWISWFGATCQVEQFGHHRCDLNSAQLDSQDWGLGTTTKKYQFVFQHQLAIWVCNLSLKESQHVQLAFWSLAYHLISAHLDFISLQYGVASIGIWKWEFCTFKKEVSHWMVHGYHGCHYILRGFHCECKKAEGKWYFSSSPSPSYWRMGPELTRLAGVPISLGLAEDRLDANLQELVIRPRSY